MIPAIWRILVAVPGLVKILEKVFGIFKLVWDKYQENKKAKWEAEKEAAIKALESAVTAEDKVNAAKKLQDLIARFP